MHLTADDIRAHILDPHKNPLPAGCEQQFKVITKIAQYLDEYPSDGQILKIIKAQYQMSDDRIRVNIRLAREMFKSKFDFDWDFLRAWEIKDQLELVRRCKEKGDIKAWNDAKKVLHTLIGECPEGICNGKRIDRTVINITVTRNGKQETIPLDNVRDLKDSEIEEIFDANDAEIDIDEAESIMQS